MTTTQTLGAARPQAGSPASRVRRRARIVLSTTLAASLVAGAGIVLGAAPASAAPAASGSASASASTPTGPSVVTVKRSSYVQIVKGTPSKFTVNVTRGGQPAPGNVVFKIDGRDVRTVALKNGVATATFPSLSPGTRKVTASYRPGGKGNAWQTVPLSVRSNKPSLSVTRSSSTQTHKGTPAKINANVKVAGEPATGTVQYKISGKVVRTVTLKNGKATATFPGLSPGNRKITVSYRGSGGSTWKTVGLKVNPVKPKGSPVVAEARKHIGTPYRYGGTTPSGFDCSGFTSYVYKKAGVKTLPRTSAAQRNAGTKVSKAAAKPGDLIWTPGHVSIYLGGNSQIDAPRPGKTIQVRQIWQSNPTFLRVSNKAIGA